LEFLQDAEGLKVKMPPDKPCDYVFALKITGLDVQSTPVKYSSAAAPAATPVAIPTELLSQ
jgi:hypothetical protein